MKLLNQGSFEIGCNYWASHAGTRMWSDWRPDVIDEDFARLEAYRIRLVRVFPLWPEFQPITMLYGQAGVEREYRFGEEPLPDTPLGRMGIREEALKRFQVLCDLARKHGIELVVGLVTGWMSGRLFVPPALEGKNIITDPQALMWQSRFVRGFVRYFAHESAIVAWDLGNECNCLAPFDTAEELYTWASLISGSIRREDPVRPIISGMHGLLPEGKWNLFHQGELTDLLTTHPYPLFTPHCDGGALNTMRTELHGTAETLMYRGIGGKPCFVEEAGTLSPMLGDEETAGAFVRTCLFSLWAHDCRGYLWWCANEQAHLTHAPYDWNAVERELGLFRGDFSPKPVAEEMKAFADFLETVGTLPPRITDALCLLSHGQDQWAAAYLSFILAKQAGLEIEYAYVEQELPEAKCYLLPSVRGDSVISRRRMERLLKRVEEGALLYLSVDDGLLSGFEQMSGMRVKGRERADGIRTVTLETENGPVDLPVYFTYATTLEPAGGEVLGRDDRGNPICCRCRYGKGTIIVFMAPLETVLAGRPGRMPADPAYYEVYRLIAGHLSSGKAARCGLPGVGLTEHILDENTRLLVLVNYEPETAAPRITLEAGWQVEEYLYGGETLEGNDAAVIRIQKKG